jgi:hypothetical protein
MQRPKFTAAEWAFLGASALVIAAVIFHTSLPFLGPSESPLPAIVQGGSAVPGAELLW